MFTNLQTSSQKWLGALFILQLLVSSALSFGFNVGACKDERFECRCGSQGRIVAVFQPQCNFVEGWEIWCRSCENGIEVKKDDVCRKYVACGSCEVGLKACKSCPQGRFGSWCEKRCNCENGGSCYSSSGQCVCRPGFQGTFCEFKTGCETPTISHPLEMKKVPNVNPLYLQFTCGSLDYQLIGARRLTCTPKTGHWSHPVPDCVPACRYPDTPLHGIVVAFGDERGRSIVSGLSIEFQCMPGFTLIGEAFPSCLENATWSHPLPSCNKTVFCPAPLQTMKSTYSVITTTLPPFFSGSELVYSCPKGYFITGAQKLSCSQNGKWSSPPPLCVQVFHSEVDCNTLGDEVMGDAGSLVRIHCPPGCGQGDFGVFGTSIYEGGSSVCQAAIHDGKISDIFGGPALVLNNGLYADFNGSNLNGIQSVRTDIESSSFKFYEERDFAFHAIHKECPDGWLEVSEHCTRIVADANSWGYAKGICQNLGSRLLEPEELDIAMEILQHSGVDEFWINHNSNSNGQKESELDAHMFSNITEKENADTHFLSNMTTLEEDNELNSDLKSCIAMQYTIEDLTEIKVSCQELLPYICIFNPKDIPKTCENPGNPDNGLARLENPSKGFERGAVLLFKCNPPYILEGKRNITCLPTLSWSSSKPTCIKVPGCLDPPSIGYGDFQILSPRNAHVSRASTKPIAGQRFNRKGGGFNPPIVKRSSEQALDNVRSIYHILGTRALYKCESRYYQLFGSEYRRCLKDGSWSGTPASCIQVCGQSDSPRTPFIINGNVSDIGQWPWQIGIGHWFPESNGYGLVCGGSLINEIWVITAAHCVTEEGTNQLRSLDTFQIYAGKYHIRSSLDDEFVQTRKVEELYVHPDYDHKFYDADIALIRLDQPVTLTTRVQPVCLPTDKSTRINLIEGRKGVVTGWGSTESSSYSEIIRQAVLPVVSNERCEEGYSKAGAPLSVSENMFCAGLEAGSSDACSGDSGGPMVFQMTSEPAKSWVLEGIISWGSKNGCGMPEQYGGFTKVHRFLDWIKQYI